MRRCPIACAAALGTLDILESDDWQARNRATAAGMWGLMSEVANHRNVIDLRQQGIEQRLRQGGSGSVERVGRGAFARVAETGTDRVLLMGDFNAYGDEDPIKAIVAGGFVSENKRVPAEDRYSYQFGGLFGYLDHALASTNLDTQVTGITEWHINADEPSVLDYNTEFKPQDLYTPTPYRSCWA